MRKVGLILIVSIFVISTFFIFYSINYPISDPNSEKERDNSEISYIQNEQPKISEDYEPNDVFSSAAPISEGYYADLNLSSDFDEDWFYIWVDFDNTLIINLNFSHNNGDINLQLRDSSNILIICSNSTTDNESIIYYVGSSDNYYIRIYNKTNPSYDLEIKIDDKFEPNNNFNNAFDIGKGYFSYLKCKDDDWFKFWIEKGEEFTVEIIFSHSIGDLNITLYNWTYGYLTGSYSSDDNEKIKWTANYSGYYYIHIYNLAVYNYYDLDIYIDWWWDDEYENNNDYLSASEVFKGLNRHLYCRDNDWYKIYLLTGKIVSVDIFFEHDFGNLDMEIYDNPSGSWFLKGNSWNDDETLSFTASFTGYYYIKVYNNTDAEENEYDMKIGGQIKTIFYEDFEGPISPMWSGVNEGNYMHVSSRDYSPDSPYNSLWCGNESTGFYNKRVNGTDIAYKESAIINDLDLRDFCYVELTFDAKLDTGGSGGDYAFISVKLLGDEYYLSPKYTNYEFILGGSSADMGWQNTTIDLSFFSGYEHVDILFNFETDDFNNYYEGVMIDNVRITGIVDDEFIGYDLGFVVGDELYYYFPYIDSISWSEVFNMGIPNYYNGQIKIKIMAINDMGSYWEVTALFWDPLDDFDKYLGTDEFKYEIYKNPINMKEGADFFIPSGDIWRYLQKADNFDGDWTGYDISHWDYWGEYHIEYRFNDFTVELVYFHTGILKGMMISKNYATNRRIFEMWYGEPNDEDEDEEDEDENQNRSIPGYDIILIPFIISIVSIVSAIKIKKSKQKKE